MKGPVRVEGLSVEVRHGNFEKALRIFSKKVQSSGKLKEVRDREHYEKPSGLRKHAKMTAKRREEKRLHDEVLLTPPRKR